MTVRGAAFLGVGAMVGAGIFALLGQVAVVAGSAVWLSFLLAGIVAALLGYTVVKLGVRYPSSGGLFAYLMQGFGNGRLVGISAWLGYFAAIVIVCSMVAVSFGSYATSLFVGDDAGSAWDNVFTTLVVVAMAAISIVGSALVSRAQSLIVFALLAVFAVFIAVTLVDIDFDLLAFSGYPPASDIVASVALTFFAYLGFSVITFAAGDMRDPEHELPKAMYRALGVTTILYVLISLGVLGTLTVDETIAYGETAIAEAARPALGEAGFTMMAIAALLATASSVNATLYASGGLTAMLSESGQFPPLLGPSLPARPARRHPRHRCAGARRREHRRPLRHRVRRERVLTDDLPPHRGRGVPAPLGDRSEPRRRARRHGRDRRRSRLLRRRHGAQRPGDLPRDHRDRAPRCRPRLRVEAGPRGAAARRGGTRRTGRTGVGAGAAGAATHACRLSSTSRSEPDDDDVLLFLATLGSALSAIGETVDAVETRLGVIARSYGLRDARFSAFPTFVLLTLGQGKAATIEPTARLSGRRASTRSPPSTSSRARRSAARSRRPPASSGSTRSDGWTTGSVTSRACSGTRYSPSGSR